MIQVRCGIRALILLLLLLLAAGATVATDNELTPHAGMRFGGEVEGDAIRVESLELRPSFGLTYAHRLSGQGWLWTAWSLQATEFDAPGLLPDHDTIDLDIHYLHVGTSFRGKNRERTHGFVMLGLGLTWVDPDPGEFDSDVGGSLLVGGGLRIPIRPAMTLRLDARGYATFTDTELKGVCGGVGCKIDFTGSGAFQMDLSAGLAFAF